jgi:hypothetical protein
LETSRSYIDQLTAGGNVNADDAVLIIIASLENVVTACEACRGDTHAKSVSTAAKSAIRELKEGKDPFTNLVQFISTESRVDSGLWSLQKLYAKCNAWLTVAEKEKMHREEGGEATKTGIKRPRLGD